MDAEQIQVDPEKYIKQLEIQRNTALSQAAQCVAVLESLQEQLAEAAVELAAAQRKIAEYENSAAATAGSANGKEDA